MGEKRESCFRAQKIYLYGGFMKSTGVVRKVDELGRIVLPIEIRKILDINKAERHLRGGMATRNKYKLSRHS